MKRFASQLKDKIDRFYYLSIFFRKVHSFLFLERIKKRKAKLIYQKFDDIIIDLTSAFNVEGITIWPAFGTLLGIIRDNGPIEHDSDIDFGVWFEELERVKTLLNDMGAKHLSTFSSERNQEHIELKYEIYGVEFDIFVFHKAESTFYCHDFMRFEELTRVETVKRYGGLLVRQLEFPYAGLKDYKYKNSKIHIPENVHDHLAFRYGEDYLTPNPMWSAKTKNDYIKIIGFFGSEIKH